jgi:hypothetical protein
MVILCDLDGVIFRKDGNDTVQTNSTGKDLVLLPGVLEKFNDWCAKGYSIILTTARKRSTRENTERQLREHGLFWDQLIMGIPGGTRVIINDLKPDKKYVMAVAVNLERNVGMEGLDIERLASAQSGAILLGRDLNECFSS